VNCNDALNAVYEAESVLPLGKRINLAFHIIFCGQCAIHMENLEKARFLLRTGFFPSSPDFSDAIMNSIYQESDYESIQESTIDDQLLETGGFSVKGWVIAGVVLLLSLGTIFFANDFTSIAVDQGSSYLLPLGIIIGVMVTGYGALFIGSHLKEFSQRFKLKF
jgi:hypothetical protein